jgi:hypothetical protein
MSIGSPWARFVLPGQYAPSPTGAPFPGAKLYFYETASTVPQATFSDAQLSIPNTNPVEANQSGIWPDIFLLPLLYRVVWTDANDNEIETFDPVAPYTASPTTATASIVLEWSVDGNGSPIGVGKKGDEECPIDCVVDEWVLMADTTCTIALDVWIAPFVANTPPVIADSIVASAPPQLVAGQSQQNSTLTGWIRNIAAGSAVRYNVSSTDGACGRFTLQLNCSPVG